MILAKFLMLTLQPLVSRAGKDAGQTKEYYTMECLLFLLKNVDVIHPEYMRRAKVSTNSGNFMGMLTMMEI